MFVGCRFPLRPFTFLIFPFSTTPSFYSFRSILLSPLYRLFLSLSCFSSSYLLNDHRYRPFDRLIHSIYCSTRSCQAAMYIYRYGNILRLTSLYHRRTRSLPCSYTRIPKQFPNSINRTITSIKWRHMSKKELRAIRCHGVKLQQICMKFYSLRIPRLIESNAE